MKDPTQAGKDFHEACKNYYDPDFTPLPREEWPEEWKTVYYKSYPRFESVTLPPAERNSPLYELVQRRKSNREFAQLGLTTQTLANLLQTSLGRQSSEAGDVSRTYPSGGARYPIEAYVILRTAKEASLKPGVYHYNVKDHLLEYLWNEPDNTPPLVHDAWAEQADAILVLTGVFARSTMKYKNNGYRLTYIDAGAILQNCYLYATYDANIKLTAYRGTHDDNIEKLLRLNTEQESLIVSALIGT